MLTHNSNNSPAPPRKCNLLNKDGTQCERAPLNMLEFKVYLKSDPQKRSPLIVKTGLRLCSFHSDENLKPIQELRNSVIKTGRKLVKERGAKKRGDSILGALTDTVFEPLL